jgi:anti-sigma-K factor RskA
MSADPHPGDDALLAMAYADRELTGEALRRFELRLAEEPELARVVNEHQRLAVLARNARPAEPMDLEWARLRRSPLQRALRGAGLVLITFGLALLTGVALWRLWHTDLAPALKLGAGAALLGTLVYFAAIARARWRTQAYDLYRNVRR